MRPYKCFKQHRASGERPRDGPPGRQVAGFIVKDRKAARFEYDDRHILRQVAGNDFEYALKMLVRGLEEPEVVERPAAACLRRYPHEVSKVLEEADRGASDLGMKIVGEGIRPEDDRPAFRARWMPPHPGLEGLGGESRQP